jgi:hypothetical protein
MKNIFETFSNLGQDFSNAQADVLIQNYWGSPVRDKMFIASFDYLDKLFETVKKVALRVVNIDKPDYVKAEWIPYTGFPLAKDINRDDVSYYVVDILTYFGDGSPENKGLKSGSGGVNALIARLAKDEGKNFVIFFASKYELGMPGGTGNGAGNPGIKIPTTG